MSVNPFKWKGSVAKIYARDIIKIKNKYKLRKASIKKYLKIQLLNLGYTPNYFNINCSTFVPFQRLNKINRNREEEATAILFYFRFVSRVTLSFRWFNGNRKKIFRGFPLSIL